MKKILLLCALVCATVVAKAFTTDDINFWAGSGRFTATMVLQWNANGETNALAFGYRFNTPETNLETMMKAIVEEHPQLKMEGVENPQIGFTPSSFSWDTNNNGSFDDAVDLTGVKDQTKGAYWNNEFNTSFDPTTWTAPTTATPPRFTSIKNGSIVGWYFVPEKDAPVVWKQVVSAPLPSDPVPSFSLDDIKNWTGTGSKRAAMVLQWNAESEQNAMAFGYRFDSDDATGADMALAIDAANPRLQVVSSTGQWGVYITSFKWDTDNNGSFDDPTDLNTAGWATSGYWGYFTKASFGDEWAYSNVGASSRKLTDGCVDGWNFGNGTVTWKQIASAPANESTGIDGVATAKSVASVRYYNLQGVASSTPFSGVNVVVTSYTDGTTATTKQIVK